MKKYISADLRVINICANDVIATSVKNPNDIEGYSEEGYEGGYAPTRRYRDSNDF